MGPKRRRVASATPPSYRLRSASRGRRTIAPRACRYGRCRVKRVHQLRSAQQRAHRARFARRSDRASSPSTARARDRRARRRPSSRTRRRERERDPRRSPRSASEVRCCRSARLTAWSSNPPRPSAAAASRSIVSSIAGADERAAGHCVDDRSPAGGRRQSHRTPCRHEIRRRGARRPAWSSSAAARRLARSANSESTAPMPSPERVSRSSHAGAPAYVAASDGDRSRAEDRSCRRRARASSGTRTVLAAAPAASMRSRPCAGVWCRRLRRARRREARSAAAPMPAALRRAGHRYDPVGRGPPARRAAWSRPAVRARRRRAVDR